MKEFFKKLWEKIKKWAVETALPWLKKSWMQIVNIIIVFMAYGRFSNIEGEYAMETVTGLWLFLLLAYYIFWKLFGFDKVWKKMMEDRKSNGGFAPQPEPPKVEVPVEPVIAPQPEAPVTIAKPKALTAKAKPKTKKKTK